VEIAGIIYRLGYQDRGRRQYGVELGVSGNRHSQWLEQPLLASPAITYKRGPTQRALDKLDHVVATPSMILEHVDQLWVL
jgi:hypothetical protein